MFNKALKDIKDYVLSPGNYQLATRNITTIVLEEKNEEIIQEFRLDLANYFSLKMLNSSHQKTLYGDLYDIVEEFEEQDEEKRLLRGKYVELLNASANKKI